MRLYGARGLSASHIVAHDLSDVQRAHCRMIVMKQAQYDLEVAERAAGKTIARAVVPLAA